MKNLYIILLAFLTNSTLAEVSFTQNNEEFSTKEIENIIAPTLTSFAQASQWADLVAIAQVDDIEYEKVRNLNAKGYAYLNILIPYKGSSENEPIAVIATGFDENICYYPDRINEGERYLVFLKKAPGELSNVYYGFKPYCQMQILLSEMGQYILRTPLDNSGISINKEMIEQHKFNDPHAMIDTTLWTGITRDKYANKFQCQKIETEDTFNMKIQLRYTQGIPIYKVRPLLKIEYKPRITSKQI